MAFERTTYGQPPPTYPSTTSSDFDWQIEYWRKVGYILGGLDEMRKAGEKYLPKFPKENQDRYDYRLKNSVFTNIYADIVNNLASKPFSEETEVDAEALDVFKALAENIDGRGNNLHVFAADTFFWGINNAIDWILVDYPKVQNTGRVLTIADERAQGVRPYWIHVRAPRMLAVYSDSVGGKEIFVHARISEVTRQRQGFSEVQIERVRIFNREPILNEFNRVIAYSPATFQLYENKVTVSGGATTNTVAWELIDEGPISIGIIPIVPVIIGKRVESSWRFIPPMRDCADAQIEHYQAETSLKSIKTLAAFPMLSGNGVTRNEDNEIEVGPHIVLYAEPYGDTSGHGQWSFVEPSGQSLTFLASEIDRLEKQMRELGRQPLTAQTGNLTVVTTAFAAQKGNSAVQQWALNLKDALEQAFVITGMWIGQAQNAPTVRVFTDFAIEMGDDVGPTVLNAMRTSRDLSRLTYWEENRRRNILSPDFDPDEEKKRLKAEQAEEPPMPTKQDLLSALTPRTSNTNRQTKKANS